MSEAGLSPIDAADLMRAGVRRKVRLWHGLRGRRFKKLTSNGLLALLCAGAFAPLLVIAPPVTVAATLAAISGTVGGGVLVEVIMKAAEGLRGDRRRGDDAEDRAAKVLATAIVQALDANGDKSSGLRRDIAVIFEQVRVPSAAIEAAGDRAFGGSDRARLLMVVALAQLQQEFTEFNFVLADVRAIVMRLESQQQRLLNVLDRPARPPSYQETLQVIRDRTGELRGREDELSQIRAFATGAPEAFGVPVAGGYLRLHGRVSAGKTALLAEAVAVLPPEVDVVAYFLRARDGDASRRRFREAVVPQLGWLLGEDTSEAHDKDEVFRALWKRAAEGAVTSGRYLLLVVDGLDEDQRPAAPGTGPGPSVAALLPERGRLGQHARVLVAGRPHPSIPNDVDDRHPLRDASVAELSVSPYASVSQEGSQNEINGLLRRDGTDVDFRYDVLGFLTAAAGALTVDNIAELSGAKKRDVRDFVAERAARSLEPVPPVDEPGYRFAHEGLYEYCADHPDVGGDPSYVDRLHSWAEEWRAKGWPPHTSPGHGTPRYLLDRYPELLAGATAGHVMRSAEPERLADLVSDVGWVDSGVSCIGVRRVIGTLREAAGILPGRGTVTSMLRLLQLQAHHLRDGDTGVRPGFTATQLGWEALRSGLDDVAASSAAHLERSPPPRLIPRWTTGQTSPQLAGVIGRHDGAVGALAVGSDGQVVSGGADGTVRVWDPAQPEEPGTVIGRHEQRLHLAIDHAYFADGVAAVAVLPNRSVVSAGSDDTIRLWDPSAPGGTGTALGRHRGAPGVVAMLDDERVVSGDGVNCLAVLPDGRVASAGGDGAIRLWDPARPGIDLGVLGEHGQNSAVLALTALPSGQVVSGGTDTMMLAWDPGSSSGSEGAVLGEHDAPVLALAALPGTTGRVVSGSGTMVRLWDAARRGTDTGLADYFSDIAALLPDGTVLSRGEDDRLLLWDSSRPSDHPTEFGPHEGNLFTAARGPRGLLVTGGSYANHATVRLWDLARPAALVAELQDPHDLWVSAVAVLQDGRIAFGGLPDGSVWLWDPSQPGEEVIWLGGHDAAIGNEILGVQLAVLPNGPVISGGDDGFIRLWDPGRPGDPIAELSRDEGAVSALAVLPAGDRRVACGYNSGVVRVWDPGRPENPGMVLGRHRGEVSTLAVLPDRRVVSGGGDGAVRLWDPDRPDDPGIELARHDGNVTAIAVLADGQEIAINSGRITLFKLLAS